MLLGPFIIKILEIVTSSRLLVFYVACYYRKELKQLILKIIEISMEWKNFKLKLKLANETIKSDLPLDEKLKILSFFYNENLQFLGGRTSKIENITGNGEAYDKIQFKDEDLNIDNGVFNANKSGKYLLSWNIPLENISTQTIGYLFLETSNQKILTISINPLHNKDTSNRYIFAGSHIVKMDAGDTAKLIIEIGTNNDPKTISISKSENSFFGGFFIGKDS
jgi:hypothetical protein